MNLYLEDILNLIHHPDTDIATLIQLMRHDYWLVRSRIAESHRMSAESLAILSKDKDHMVRRRVAQNRNTNTDTLRELSQHHHLDILTQTYVHMHHNAPFGLWIHQMRIIP